jgi:hypothetical protein
MRVRIPDFPTFGPTGWARKAVQTDDRRPLGFNGVMDRALENPRLVALNAEKPGLSPDALLDMASTAHSIGNSTAQ